MALAATPTVVPMEERELPKAGAAPVVAPVDGEDHTGRDVVLDVRKLVTYFYTYDGVVRALDGVSFKVRQGETLGLVGETGCGKSVTAFSITRLIPDPPGRVVSGKVLYRGADLLWELDREAKFKPVKGTNRVKVSRRFRRIKAAMERMMSVRGRGISMIFQEPMQAMNPVFPIWDQLGEAIYLHRGVEVIDGLLSATPHDPSVAPAVDALLDVGRSADRTQLREAAQALARAAHLPSLETEAFYAVRDSLPDIELARTHLNKALKRLKLSGLQRAYLRRERRRIELSNKLRDTYLEEMRLGRHLLTARAPIRSANLSNQARRWPLRLWGIRRHVDKPVKEELLWRSVTELEGVRIANPVQVAKGFPHELSGGMLQRVMIAMALAPQPSILLADEPTTALDVTIQAQILELMNELKRKVGTAIVLITHDLAVIAEVADRVCVMYAGQIVENAPVRSLFQTPLHPYAQGLLVSIPRIDRPEKKLESIPGSVPNLIFPPAGCRFHPRCPYAMPVCREVRPPMTDEGNGHQVACHLYHGPTVTE